MVAGVSVLSLRLLGPFHAVDAKRAQLISISSRRARALLAYLAMQSGRSVDREELADLLWDPQQGRDTRHNLRQCLVDLRKLFDSFPGLLVTERDAIALNSDLCQIDAILFAECVEAGDIERASALHNGVFLKGLNIAAESFGTWVRNERTRISAIAERLFAQTVQLSLSSGDGKKVIAAAEGLWRLIRSMRVGSGSSCRLMPSIAAAMRRSCTLRNSLRVSSGIWM
jgi:two-component SAPR family response regulator